MEQLTMRDANGHEHEPAGSPGQSAHESGADDGSVFSDEEKQALRDYFDNHQAINTALKQGETGLGSVVDVPA
jgi:hypothetical protein